MCVKKSMKVWSWRGPQVSSSPILYNVQVNHLHNSRTLKDVNHTFPMLHLILPSKRDKGTSYSPTTLHKENFTHQHTIWMITKWDWAQGFIPG